MPNGMMSRGVPQMGARPGGVPPRGGTPGGAARGAQPGQQERVLMTLLTMLSQMPEAQVMLPVGALSDLVEGGGMGSLQPSAVGAGGGRPGMGIPQRGPGVAPQARRPMGGAVRGGMPRQAMPPRQGLGGAQPRGNTQALMGLLGGRL